MNSPLHTRFLCTTLLASLTVMSQTARAQLDLTNGATVISESGNWGAEHNDFSRFFAQATIDNNFTEPTVAPDGSGNTEWLGREGFLGENFALDLGQSAVIGQIKLYNTHNGQFNDRGTDAFHILASNSVAGNVLVNPVTLLSGNLSNVDTQPTITPNVFPINNPGTFRYIQFFADTAQPDVPPNNVGLNEIEVFSVPEPSAALALLGGVTLLGALRRYGRARWT